MNSLFVATPMYGGMCNGLYTLGMLQMPATFGQAGVGMHYAHMMNESLITRARNSLAHDFLESQCTHLMFIDADIGFNPADIIPMINADKDIICGLYPRKEINWVQVKKAVESGVPADQLHLHTGAFVFNAVGNADELSAKISDPCEISNGGTGFMLIKREVFEKLADVVPQYVSDMYRMVDVPSNSVIKEFFDTSIDNTSGDRLLSEDYHFCKLARDNGFKVWAAPWAQLTHCGTYNFSGYLPRV